MAKTPSVALRIDPELWQASKVATAERGDTMTGQIERWISEYTGLTSTRGTVGRGPQAAALQGVHANRRDLLALRYKAERARDLKQIMICDLALDGNEEALAKCARLIEGFKSGSR